MGNHVFISYARADQAYVRALTDELRRRGFEVWLDDRIDFGDRWWRTIVQAIQECAALVVVMTPDSDESPWVEREILLAERLRKPIFPLLLRGQEFAIFINTQYADVTDGRLPPPGFYARLGRSAPPNQAERLTSRSQTPREAWERGEREKDSPPRIGEGPGEGSPRQPFEPELILIPAGEFLMGSDPEKDKNAQDDEQPQHRLYLPDFYIAKTPVTNAQFAAFVKASGYRTTAEEKGEGYGWTGQKWDTIKGANWQHPRGPQSDITAKSDHPVVQVSWYDAVTYCRWLAGATGRPYRLPTEAEWEKAARGPQGLIYPWGNTWATGRCNSSEAGVGDTTSVGAYPNGASPYGVLDMAGNVWDWCATKWQKAYPYEVKEDEWAAAYLTGTDVRVLRGGSWYFNLLYARCAYRDRNYPEFGSNDLGFRLVSPI